MAVTFMTGFEVGTSTFYNAWNPTGLGVGSVGGAFSTTAAQQHRTQTGIGGNYSIRHDASGSGGQDGRGWSSPLFSPGTSYRWVHLWWKRLLGNTYPAQILFYRSASAQFSVQILNSGFIELRLGSRTGTLLATSAAAYSGVGDTYWIAINAKLKNGTNGAVRVYINGVLAVQTGASDNIDTAATASDDWDQVHVLGSTNLGSPPQDSWCFDDVIITDDTTSAPGLSEYMILPLVPTSDDTVQMTRSTGANNFGTVDEVPPSTTDYNEATASGQEDIYGFSDTTFTPQNVLAVQSSTYVARDGVIVSGQHTVVSGATTNRTTAETLSASGAYRATSGMWITDPNTGIAWTAANINAAKFGYKFT